MSRERGCRREYGQGREGGIEGEEGWREGGRV